MLQIYVLLGLSLVLGHLHKILLLGPKICSLLNKYPGNHILDEAEERLTAEKTESKPLMEKVAAVESYL